MKLRLIILTLFITNVAATTFGQQAKLEGQVFDDRDRPTLGTRIIAPGGQATVTDNKGHFNIRFPASILPGQAIRIEVAKPNWVIFQPMFGNCVTQSTERNYEPLRVIIVPKGSPLALSPKRLSQVIAQWARERVNLRAEVGNLKQNLDEYAFFQEYAKEYGFTLEQFRDAAQQWAQIKDSDDKEERALKEYWQKNYGRVTQLALESAQAADEELKQANKKTTEVSLKVIRRYELAGNAYYAQYKFGEALNAYNEIEKRFETRELSKESFIAERAELRILIGDTKTALGIRVKGAESQQLLTEAVAELQETATYYSREQFPQQWARTKNELGIALERLGERVAGPDSIKYLNDAGAAFHAALEVRSREQFPQQWAATQVNLALSLVQRGDRVAGKDGLAFLSEAVVACRSALEVYGREQFPQEWATTQDNLGIALYKQGTRLAGDEGIGLLRESAASFRLALEVRTREQVPELWASTNENLGNSLADLGVRVDGEEGVRLLRESVAAFRRVLEVRTREKLPQPWADTQINLGVSLQQQGVRLPSQDGTRLLGEAAVAFSNALEVYSRDQFPQDWAFTQNDLGIVLRLQAIRTPGEDSMRLLKESESAYRSSLEVFTRVAFPSRWATVQDNLASVLADQAERSTSGDVARLFNESLTARHLALEVFTQETAPQAWARITENLGISLTKLGERTDGEAGIRLLTEAVDAHRDALKVRTLKALPQNWASTQTGLGDSLVKLGVRTGGDSGAGLLREAINAYKLALQVRTLEHLPQDWAETENGLADAYYQLKDWANAAECYTNVLKVDPNDENAYKSLTKLYQDILFRFTDAYEITRRWVDKHPDDLTAMAEFSEMHFTTERFADSQVRVTSLLMNPDVDVKSKVALRAVEIANLVALNKVSMVRPKMVALLQIIDAQPADFKVTWDFNGTAHFVTQSAKFVQHRDWLLQLFGAMKGENRDAIANALRRVRIH
jgi:tetratricopeptide (TPR) repeat protein